MNTFCVFQYHTYSSLAVSIPYLCLARHSKRMFVIIIRWDVSYYHTSLRDFVWSEFVIPWCFFFSPQRANPNFIAKATKHQGLTIYSIISRFLSFCRVGTGLSDEECDTLVTKLKPYFRYLSLVLPLHVYWFSSCVKYVSSEPINLFILLQVKVLNSLLNLPYHAIF